MSDLLYYYALLATALTIIISLLKILPSKFFSKLHELLPTPYGLLQLLLN